VGGGAANGGGWLHEASARLNKVTQRDSRIFVFINSSSPLARLDRRPVRQRPGIDWQPVIATDQFYWLNVLT
jgi:hypothetical protein